MSFTLRQIEIFVEAAKDQNFRKTADRLGISQPAISRHVRLLEDHAGGKLFLRERGSTARLAPLGQEMLAEARALLRTARKVGSSSRPEDAGEVTLKIAAGNYLLDRWIRPNLRRITAGEEGVHLEFVQAAEHEQLLELLGQGEVDYAFYTGNPVDMPGLVFVPLRTTTIGIYAAPALARQVACLPDDLNALPFVLGTRDTRSEEWQRATLAAGGVVPHKVAARSQFMEVLLDYVLEGRGAALLFDADARPHVDAGRLVRFAVELPAGSRIMVSRAGARPDARKQRVITALCRLLEQDQA